MRPTTERFKPSRRWGQNFLINPGAVEGIIAAFAPRPEDLVLEIGPGDGALTRRLAGRVRHLVALEIDPALAEPLRSRIATEGPGGRFDLLVGDVLEADLGAILASMGAGPDRPARVIGNLPYNIATAVILRFVLERPAVRDLLVMVQREVAERILSLHGRKTYGGLSVLCQTFARSEGVMRLRPGSFRPRPKVESEVIRLTPRNPGGGAGADPRGFAALVAAAFAHRRKTLQNNLALLPRVEGSPGRLPAREAGAVHRGALLGAEGAAALLRRAGLDPRHRAEAVTPAGFAALFETRRAGGL